MGKIARIFWLVCGLGLIVWSFTLEYHEEHLRTTAQELQEAQRRLATKEAILDRMIGKGE